MENSTITLLIRYFNILSTTVMAFFAIYGAITLFGKRSSLNIFRSHAFIQAFCVAALFAFVLESTVSNFEHYLKYFADGEFHTLEVSPQDSTIILTSDGTLAETFIEKKDTTARDSSTASTSKTSESGTSDSALARTSSSIDKNSVTSDSTIILASVSVSADTSFKGKDSANSNDGADTANVMGGIIFKNLDRRVTSVFIEPVFDSSEWIVAIVTLTNKEMGKLSTVRTLYKGMPNTYHIQIQPCGKVTELKIMLYGAKRAGASKITINKQIPLYFSGLRLIVVSLFLFAVILFAYKPLRVKATYLLFDYRFDPSNKKQNAVYILSVILLILFSWICAYTSVIEDRPQARQYNEYLVDALLAGRVYLDAGNPEKMLKAPNPYDLQWLDENKYERGVDWMPDWVYYKGKFYCYFGAVPALMLYVPYTLITEDYLSNHAGIFIFAALSIILLARLWRFLVRTYMPDARFAFYLLSYLALFFSSGLFCPLRFTRFYSIVSSAGFMFVVAGILLLFESIEHEKPDRSKLFFAAACFAMAVGSRPNLLFASLIVPVVLWKHKLWKCLPLIALPYIAAAVPMCMYNYARFGSILEFGPNYNMTTLNLPAYSLLNPIGKLLNTFNASLSYLFTLNHYSFFYPYVESVPQHGEFFWSIVRFYDKGCGMLNFPIVFCLFFFFKAILRKENRPKTFYISATFLAIAAVLIVVNSWMIGHSGRYLIDFSFFIILPSLFCAYYWCDGVNNDISNQPSNNQIPIRVRRKVVYALLVVSIFVGLFLFATTVTNDATPYNPVLFRYMQQSLIILGIV